MRTSISLAVVLLFNIVGGELPVILGFLLALGVALSVFQDFKNLLTQEK